MIAKEGFKIILPALAVSILLSIMAILFPLWPIKILLWISLLFFLFSLYFFRDPERQISKKEKIIVSPADGKVVGVQDIQHEEIGEAKLIEIFMSVFNVHINRMPFDGKVISTKHTPGKFLSAFSPDASAVNEQNCIIIEKDGFKISITQIAGLIARRIISYLSVGDEVKKGAKFGLIMFGSKVDIVVPANVELSVKIGDKVCGGSSIIGEIK